MIIWKDSSYYQPNILVNKQNINKINKNEKTKHKTKATEEIFGEYGYKKSSDIIKGQIYLKGHYLKRITDTKKTITVYPFVNFEINNCTYLKIIFNEYSDILPYVEHFLNG